MSSLRRGYLILLFILIGVIVWGIEFHISNQIHVNNLEINSDASDPYPSLRFEVSNQGDKDIIAIRASINEIDLPYTFGVSEEHPLEPSRICGYSGYTGWYEPGGGVGGFIPDEFDGYNIKVKIMLSDGKIWVFKKSGIFRDSHGASIASICGFDTLYFRGADLMAKDVNGTLNMNFRNGWVIESSQTVKRLEVHVGERVVWEEDVKIDFTRYFAVTVEIPFELEPGRYYDITLIAYSAEGNISTYTGSTLCQKYEIGK